MDFFQQLVLGIIQGITEWIPVSSEGALLFVSSNFFGNVDINLFLRQALLLHLGTFFAALIYFRKRIKILFEGFFNYDSSDPETRKTLKFLVISTFISGILGLAILNFLNMVDIEKMPLTSSSINFFLGTLLIITGFLQLKASSAGYRKEYHLNNRDSISLGIMQGFAALPGLSRSGLTISTLLFRNFDETTALRLSFIMSLPIILLGNILLNLRDFVLLKEMIFGVVVAFAVGLLTIHLLMEFSKKVRFGFFVISFGILVIIAGIIGLF